MLVNCPWSTFELELLNFYRCPETCWEISFSKGSSRNETEQKMFPEDYSRRVAPNNPQVEIEIVGLCNFNFNTHR